MTTQSGRPRCPQCGSDDVLFSDARQSWNCAPCGGFWFRESIPSLDGATASDSMTPEEQMAAVVIALKDLDFTQASEESLALFVDLLSRVVGKASVAQRDKWEERHRHIQETDESWPYKGSSDRGGTGAVLPSEKVRP